MVGTRTFSRHANSARYWVDMARRIRTLSTMGIESLPDRETRPAMFAALNYAANSRRTWARAKGLVCGICDKLGHNEHDHHIVVGDTDWMAGTPANHTGLGA